MIIIEKDGYDFMLTGVTQEAIDKFYEGLNNTPYSGVVGVIQYNVPKNNKIIPVFIISADTKSSREYCLEYWEKLGHNVAGIANH